MELCFLFPVPRVYCCYILKRKQLTFVYKPFILQPCLLVLRAFRWIFQIFYIVDYVISEQGQLFCLPSQFVYLFLLITFARTSNTCWEEVVRGVILPCTWSGGKASSLSLLSIRFGVYEDSLLGWEISKLSLKDFVKCFFFNYW